MAEIGQVVGCQSPEAEDTENGLVVDTSTGPDGVADNPVGWTLDGISKS